MRKLFWFGVLTIIAAAWCLYLAAGYLVSSPQRKFSQTAPTVSTSASIEVATSSGQSGSSFAPPASAVAGHADNSHRLDLAIIQVPQAGVEEQEVYDDQAEDVAEFDPGVDVGPPDVMPPCQDASFEQPPTVMPYIDETEKEVNTRPRILEHILEWMINAPWQNDEKDASPEAETIPPPRALEQIPVAPRPGEGSQPLAEPKNAEVLPVLPDDGDEPLEFDPSSDAEDSEIPNCQEDPNHPYHYPACPHNGCPDRGTYCPYTGKYYPPEKPTPPAEPQEAPDPSDADPDTMEARPEDLGEQNPEPM
ncbi:MAG: hypothetical protein KatS3mg105_3714 [Gemmatales bacterium]|nr:MAG: hypothetical protein KatS3mg105_3714 [Gemmatales bacterium]